MHRYMCSRCGREGGFSSAELENLTNKTCSRCGGLYVYNEPLPSQKAPKTITLKIYIDSDETAHTEKIKLRSPTPEVFEKLCESIGTCGYYSRTAGCYWPPHRIHKVEVQVI